MVFQSDVIIGDVENPFVIEFNTHDSELVTIYPNPVGRGEVFNINLPDDETVKEIIVTNMTGVVVSKMSGVRRVNGIPASGVYDIKITTLSGNTYHGRLVVK